MCGNKSQYKPTQNIFTDSPDGITRARYSSHPITAHYSFINLERMKG